MNKEMNRERDRELPETGLYLFELIRAALHGIKAREKPETCEWKELYQLAKSNDVENLCVYGIKTLENLPPMQLWNQWKKLPEYITFRMLKVDLERERILKELEEKSDAVVGWNPHCIINAIETLVDGEDWAKPCDAVEEY